LVSTSSDAIGSPASEGGEVAPASSTRCPPQYYALHFADVIQNFRSRPLKRFLERGAESRIRADHRTTVRDILARLSAASGPEDMNLPGFGLHALRGEYRGFWAVTVRANWRVIFRFEGEHAVDVDYLDYH
jgi:proteic killer suppression protein